MIKINLALKKQTGGADGGKGGGGGGPLGKMDFDAFKGVPIRKIAVPLVVGFLASYLLDNYKEEQLKKLEEAVTKSQNEASKYLNDAQKYKTYEPIKKQLDDDEALLRTKLDVVKKLTAMRGAQGKLLSAVSSTIPAEVWLTDFRVEKNEVVVRGASLGYGQISDFMKSLNENSNFSGFELKNSQQDKDGGLEIATFELKGKRR
ncbi:MAG: PilN domain-containing protein [Bdellovibrio sp.]|nr:PilN domain-containing protein [Bdellovibrio sp.]